MSVSSFGPSHAFGLGSAAGRALGSMAGLPGFSPCSSSAMPWSSGSPNANTSSNSSNSSNSSHIANSGSSIAMSVAPAAAAAASAATTTTAATAAATSAVAVATATTSNSSSTISDNNSNYFGSSNASASGDSLLMSQQMQALAALGQAGSGAGGSSMRVDLTPCEYHGGEDACAGVCDKGLLEPASSQELKAYRASRRAHAMESLQRYYRCEKQACVMSIFAMPPPPLERQEAFGYEEEVCITCPSCGDPSTLTMYY